MFERIPTEPLVSEFKDLKILSRLTPDEASAVDTYKVELATGQLGVLKIPRVLGTTLDIFEDTYKLRAKVGRAVDAGCVGVLHQGTINASTYTGIPFAIFEWEEGEVLPDPLRWTARFPYHQETEKAHAGFTYAEGALRACSALHANGLVHRDVKPNNLVFGSSGSARLIDLDTLMAEGDEIRWGTWNLYSPNESCEHGFATTATDIYVVACATVPYLGALAMETTRLFANLKLDEILKRRSKGPTPEEIAETRLFLRLWPEAVQDQVARLIDLQVACLKVIPRERPDAKTALEILTERKNLKQL